MELSIKSVFSISAGTEKAADFQKSAPFFGRDRESTFFIP